MRRGLLSCYAASFVASVLQVLYLPALSLYLSEMGYGAGEVGLISGGASLLYALGAASSGLATWRAGSRGVAVASSTLLSVSYLALAFLDERAAVLAAGLGMLSYALFWPSVELGVAAGGGNARWFSFSWSLGTVAGSLVVPLLLGADLRHVFLAFTGLAVAMAAAATRIPQERGERPAFEGVRRLWRTWLGAFTYAASLGGILVYYPLYVEARSLPAVYAGLLLFSVLAARTLAFMLVDPGHRALLAAPLLLGAGAIVPWAPPLLLVAAGAAVGAGEALVYSAALNRALEARGALYTGLFEASIGLGYAAGPILGGLAASFSLPAALAVPAVAASLMAVPAVMDRR